MIWKPIDDKAKDGNIYLFAQPGTHYSFETKAYLPRLLYWDASKKVWCNTNLEIVPDDRMTYDMVYAEISPAKGKEFLNLEEVQYIQEL
jgi:hypothetical protein